MGNNYDNSKVIKICVIGEEKGIINRLFPYSMKVEDKVSYRKRNLHKNIEAKDNITGKSERYKIFWEAYIFPEITKNNRSTTKDTIFYDIFGIPKNKDKNSQKDKKLISSNNVIIIFGSKNADFLLKEINKLTRVYLPQIAIITDEEIGELKDNRYLTKIKHKEENKLYKNIFNYLWERECYFNQRGYLINEYSPENIIPSKDLPCSSLNIMLTGMSRAGKSTLINILSEKLVSLETPELTSVTNEIKEYIIYREIKENGKEKEIIKLKFIDTPGLIYDPNDNKRNRTQEVIDSIEKKIKEFEDTNESIHIIYFFMPDKPNLVQSKMFFDYLNKLNSEKTHNNLPKLPILFVFNGKLSDSNKDALIKFLNDNKFNNLYEEAENDENDENERLSLSQESNEKNEEDDIIEDNIIELDLLEFKKGLKKVFLGYGLSKLLRATKYFIKKRNPFNIKDFDKIKLYIQQFKEYNRNKELIKEEEKNFELLKQKCKDLIIKVTQENDLLCKLRNENKIIQKARNEANNIIYIISGFGFLVGMIPVPYADIPLLYMINYGMITKIGNCFNVKYSEIPFSIYLRLIFGLGADVQSSAKIVGNRVASSTGESFGKDLIYDIGEEQIQNWAKDGLHVVTHGGNVNVVEVAENLLIKDESKFNNFLTYIYNLFPSFNKSVQKGLESGGQQLGKQLENVLIENTSNLSKDFVYETSEKIGKAYGEQLVCNGGNCLKGFTPKIIPIFGSLVGGAMDWYSIYNVGKESINYFEDYIKKTMGCEFIVKRKEEYEKILNSLDIIANGISDNFKVNVVN